MKYLVIAFLLFSSIAFSQKPCEYSTDVTDSIGTYKATKSYVVHERNFAGKSSYIFFTLVNVDEMPMLKLQQIEKSSEFLKVSCFDAGSKLYLQLVNGKIVTLLHTNEESCGSMVPISEEKKYSRLLEGSFMFIKGSIEDLKSSPVSLLRIKYTTGMVDYVFQKQLVSELTKETYAPENYFINFLSCIE